MKIPVIAISLPILMMTILSTTQKNAHLYMRSSLHRSIYDNWNIEKDTVQPTLIFSNYTWYIKSGDATPGPNSWSAENAFVDSLGRLHMKITFNAVSQKWECSEIWTTDSLGFGTYEWQLEGSIDNLDKNVVLGLFNYPASPTIPDGTNEIDIEFAKWGLDNNKLGNFTIWPSKLIEGYENNSQSFAFSLTNTKTTHRFTWQPHTIGFESLEGWKNEKMKRISSKTFRSNNSQWHIPQSAEPVHINLWLFKGLSPSNKEPVEIIISRFLHYK